MKKLLFLLSFTLACVANVFAITETELDQAVADGTVITLQIGDQYLYGSTAQNCAMGDAADALSDYNAVVGFKVEKDNTGYLFRAVTPSGGDFYLWGNSPCYLNAQPAGDNKVTFILGKNQDGENLSSWAVEDGALKCVGSSQYFNGTTMSSTPVEVSIITIEALNEIVGPEPEEEEITVLESLKPFIDNKTVFTLKSGDNYVYGPSQQNIAVGTWAEASATTNNANGYILENDDYHYYLRAVKADGSNISAWGVNPCWLNNDGASVVFNMGKDQDTKNGSSWIFAEVADGKYTIESVNQPGKYLGVNGTAGTLSETATEWELYVDSNTSSTITNPGFETRDFTGWVNNGFELQSNTAFAAKTGDYYAEKWVLPSQTLSDASLMQTITELPNGTYRVSAMLQNVEQGNGDVCGTGMFLVANDSQIEVTTVAEKVEVLCDVTDGTLTFGVKLVNCSGNWAACDNFEVTLVEDNPESTNIAQGEVGTCVWYIDAEGTLVIAPADGVSGDLPEEGWNSDIHHEDVTTAPWGEHHKSIFAAEIKAGVNAKSCSALFCGLRKMASLDLSNFDTQNVTDMGYMFAGCQSLTSLDISKFDTQNVTNMEYMFHDCFCITSLDLSNFDTQKVTSMSWMFHCCQSLTSLDVSNFNTHNLMSISGMFWNCHSLTSLDLSSFETQQLTSMRDIFQGCGSLTTLNLTNFNTQNVTDMDYIFFACHSLSTIISNNEIPSKLKVGTFSEHFDNRDNCTLIVPKGSKARYAAADGWNELGNIEEAAVNMIYVENGVTEDGEELALPVYMENPDEISAFQFDVTLPEGMKLGEDGVTLDTLRTTEEAHTLTYREIEDGVYRVVCYSTNLATFSGNDGVVAYIHLIADTVGNYQVKLSGIEMSTVDMTKFTPEESVCEITVETSTNDLTYMQFAERMEETLSALSTTQSNTVGEYLDEDNNVTNTKYAEIVLEYLNVFKDIATSIDKINDAATIAHENGVMAESIEDLTAALDSIDAVLAEIPAEFEADIAERNTFIARGKTGTCSWIIDNDGLLTIAPADGESGTLDSYIVAEFVPWYKYNESIIAAKVDNGVSATSCANLFTGLAQMKTIDLSGLNTQNVTSLYGMFSGCTGLTRLDLSNFNTENVTNMSSIFSGCSGLTSLDVSSFNTQKVKTLRFVFAGCSALANLDVNNFDTQNVTDMYAMFASCSGLKELNLTGWDMSSCTNLGDAFLGCNSLRTIYSYNENPTTLKAGFFADSFVNRDSCTLIVPRGSKELYAAADGWNELGKIIDDDDIAEDLFGELAVSVSEDENIATDALEDLALTFPNALAGTEGYEDYVMSLNGDAKVVLVDSEGTTVEEAYAHEVDSVGTVTFSAKLKRGEEYMVIVPRGLYIINNEEKTYASAADTLSYTTDYVLGDVNNDSRHSVTDIVGVASYILNGSEEVGLLVVDCNRDEEATVTDISHLASKIMTDRFPWEDESSARLVAPVAKPQLCLTDNAHGLALSFDNARDFCSMQFDVTLTDDLGNNITSADAVKVKASAGTQGHTVATGMVDGKMRVLVYSVANKAFTPDFNLNVDINANADLNVSITNAELTSNALTAVPLEGIEAHLSTTDGINSLTVSAETSQLYDLAGRRLSNPTARGIYVVGKKKVVK